MATVIITERLIREVCYNVARLYEKDIEEAYEYPRTFGELFLEAAFPSELREAMNKLPEAYFYDGKDLILRVMVGNVSIRIGCSESIRLPLQFDSVANGCTGAYSSLRINSDDPRWSKLADAVHTWAANHRRVVEERKQAEESARATLTKFGSLAPALKAWPALWDLLPERTKERHRQPATRNKKRAATIDETLVGPLTGKLAMAKILEPNT